MVSLRMAVEMAMALPNVALDDHYGRDVISANGQNFVAVWRKDDSFAVRLSPEKKKEVLEHDGEAFEDVDSSYGRDGWTTVNLEFIDRKTLKEVLKAAHDYSAVKTVRKKKAKKKMAAKKKGKAKR